jgi:hypothetical protein
MAHRTGSRSDDKREAAPEVDARRRAALRKLGLAAGVAYGTPTVLHLDRAAAMKPSCPPPRHGCGRGNSGNPPPPPGPSDGDLDSGPD